ncbi:hypothetical protein HMPREF9466_02011 [Fusobacterium necrophorum subsp. funduliforme 1_1_36S]|nr:hypothetical protein HMPREF9466_02011 [Fusobacterium necrophorum subsp. funduliforme 1_1_36S]
MGRSKFSYFLSMLLLAMIVVYVPFGGEESGFLRANFLTIFALLGVFGLLFGEIGDRIPFWDEYIGGGTVLVFFAAAVFGTYQLVPEPVVSAIKIFYGKQPVNFLEMFIPALIVGSVLTVDRRTLIKIHERIHSFDYCRSFGSEPLRNCSRTILWKVTY